jgi:hypothetical protein
LFVLHYLYLRRSLPVRTPHAFVVSAKEGGEQVRGEKEGRKEWNGTERKGRSDERTKERRKNERSEERTYGRNDRNNVG